jgi:hypothetical protein
LPGAHYGDPEFSWKYEVFRKPSPGKGKNATANFNEDELSDPATLPINLTLLQNYPNSFNPITRIRYALPEALQVRLEVIDMMGRCVALLVEDAQEAGWHEVLFDVSQLPSGLYVYRLQAGSYSETMVMTILK